MPDIHFTCPQCSQPIDAPEELAGQTIDCPDCKSPLTVPAPGVKVPKITATQGGTITTMPQARSGPCMPPFESITDVTGTLWVCAFIQMIGSLILGLLLGDHVAKTTSGFGPVIIFAATFFTGILGGCLTLGFVKILEFAAHIAVNTRQSDEHLERIEALLKDTRRK